MNLLDRFALLSTQVVKLHAELHRVIATDEPIQARVEIKLSPAQLPDETGAMPSYQVGVRLSCEGIVQAKEQERAFTIECVVNATYRQIDGTPIDFSVFSQHHASLTRQIYPLIHQQLMPLLIQLGLHNVRLPQDIVHTKVEQAPTQVH